jgi:CheY-like chemotaxis protein
MSKTTRKERPRVLLVEDEPLICDVAAEALEEQGFVVKAVATARDALHCLKTGLRIDILFTDVNLPGDMDGAALARQARAMRPDLPVMYTSGRCSHQLDTVEGSMFVAKPYNPFDLGRLVNDLVAARRVPAKV